MKIFNTPKWFRFYSKELLWSFSLNDSNEVFLTFDDGPNEDITPYILKRLEELQWKATFFCVGENAQKKPELLQQIIKSGHAIGNHTYNHLNGLQADSGTYMANIEQANIVLKSNLFRPPYGKIFPKTIQKISQQYKIVMWSFMAYDFDKTISMESITLNAQKFIKPGSIIVLHDNEKFIQREKEAFEVIVKVLQEKNLSSNAIRL